MDEPSEIRLGDYLVRVDGDVLHCRADGEATAEIAHGLVRLLGQIQARHGRFFIIGDLKDAGTVGPVARRIFIDFSARHAPLAVAFYRVNLMARGVNALLIAAANLLSKQRHNVRQFSTEQEARSWIGAERRRLVKPEP